MSPELRMESRLRGRASVRTEPSAASRFTGRRVHFIGIGGCGMAGLARMLLDAGAIVTGSEPKPNPQTFDLVRRGATITRDQMGELLADTVDLVVRTAAIREENLELTAARKLGLRQMKYAQLLGQVMEERFGVAAAGTHGKSTTTAMIAYALMQCGLDPSFVVGGTSPQLGGSGSHSGTGRVFVAEACEFDRSFHNLRPRVALISNIEEDHLDCYRNLGEIIESFGHFARLVPADGLILANGSDNNVAAALQNVAAPVESVGLGPAGRFCWASDITGIEEGCYRGRVFRRGAPMGELRLSIAGEHNLFNGTMALAACVACGAEAGRAIEAINGFAGVDRRMTLMGRFNGAAVVDDYGHHPTEVRATLTALRQQYRPRRLLCVFQPHQHSRTRFLLEDFAASFTAADQTIVPDIYFVRDSEAERQRVSAGDLVARIRANGLEAVHLPEFADIVAHLRRTAGAGDLVVTMGAGNVWEIGRDLVGDEL